MPMCTPLRDSIWDTERGFCLVETGLQLEAATDSFPSFRSHPIVKLPQMSSLLVWHCGKEARITRLHFGCQAIHVFWSCGKSTSDGGQACRCAFYKGGRASGGHSQMRDYFEPGWIFGDDCAMRFRCWLPSCWDHWAFYNGWDPARGVPCQEGHDPPVCSMDIRTEKRHAIRDDVDRYTVGNLQATLVKLVSNTWSRHLQRELVIPALGFGILCDGGRLQYPPVYLIQHLTGCFPPLIQVLRRYIAVLGWTQ